MSSSDGERIAPVTYLFGAQPQADADDRSPSEAPAASAAEPVATTKQRDRGNLDRGNFDRISNVSMYALARRGMSSGEMRDYLIGREFETTEVDEEVERLERVALLDDTALAETLVRTLQSRKGLGASAVSAELRRRKIDGSAIEESMLSLGDDELHRATEIAVRRAPQLRGLDKQTAQRRLGAFLMRKGYSGSVVSAAVAAALAPDASAASSSGPVFR